MPTRPNSWRLASATNALPGPTSMSTGAIVLGAEGHGRDGLHAAERVDLVRAAPCASPRRWPVRGVPATAARSRDHALHAGDLGRHHAHVRRSDHRIPPARNVTADATAPECSCGRAPRPDIVSTSTSRSAARCLGEACESAPARIECRRSLAAATAVRRRAISFPKGGTTPATTCRIFPSIRAPLRRRAGRCRASKASTVARTCASSDAASSAFLPFLR